MTYYIVEHRIKGNYVRETIAGVEDIDMSMYKDLIGVWVCDTFDEMHIMEKELRALRNRGADPECGK